MSDLNHLKELYDDFMMELVEHSECDNFLCAHRKSKEMEEDVSTIDRLKIDAMGLKEFNLKKLNGKPINENKNAAWELIEGAYCIVLEKDPKWHFFCENSYNIIRCSAEYEDALKEYLNDCGVTHTDPVVWVDGQPTTFEFQHIFCPMFHTFSMMALMGYSWRKLNIIFDRVYHCFFNHQSLYMGWKYGNLGVLWESNFLADAAVSRAHYNGSLNSNLYHKNEREREYKERWRLEKYLAKTRKWIKRKTKKNTNPA